MAESRPSGLRDYSVSLPRKLNCDIEYSYLAGTPDALWLDHLLVFINGLIMPQAAWHPVISAMLEQGQGASRPPILTYGLYAASWWSARKMSCYVC